MDDKDFKCEYGRTRYLRDWIRKVCEHRQVMNSDLDSEEFKCLKHWQQLSHHVDLVTGC